MPFPSEICEAMRRQWEERPFVPGSAAAVGIKLPHDILTDPELSRDPGVVACLQSYRYGDCTLDEALLAALRYLVRLNKQMFDANLELNMRLPTTPLFEQLKQPGGKHR